MRMRVVAWNLRHGGGRRVAEIALALAEHAPDVVVLTEFHGQRGGGVRGVMADRGLTHQVGSVADGDENSVLVASRWPMRADPERLGAFPGGVNRWVDVEFASGLRLSGVHVPDDTRRAAKASSWHFLNGLARGRGEGAWVVAGDFNSGRHGIDEVGRRFTGTALLGTFCTLGMTDAWRELNPHSRERSWVGPRGEATRIDAVFVSRGLRKSLQRAYFTQEPRERGVSDHAMLVVELGGVETGGCGEGSGLYGA